MLDRNVDTDRYTQFVGGDNKLIGRAAGEYAVELARRRRARPTGNVVEIWGGMGTQPAHDRHDGFHEFTDKEPGIKYLLDQQSGDWKQDQAYNIMATALRNNEKIDLVYGHNDPMAYGAYLAAKDVGREKEIKFIGIDALPDEGVMWVKNGELTATFLYATPGAEGLRQALKFLNGEKVEKTVTLDTEQSHHGERRRGAEVARHVIQRFAAISEPSFGTAGLVAGRFSEGAEMDWLNEPPSWREQDGVLVRRHRRADRFLARDPLRLHPRRRASPPSPT